MGHEMLSAKLCELDTKLGKLHGRIRSGEHLSGERLKEEIQTLRIELNEEEKRTFTSLLSSKADISTELRMEFQVLKDKYRSAFEKLEKELEEDQNWEEQSEKKSLFAEYGIDFVMIAADHALLLALTAIEAQKELEQEDNLS